MKFTTHLELHSQTTRLVEGASHGQDFQVKNGILTLYDVLFQGTLTEIKAEASSTNYNSDPERARFQIWAVAASLAVTEAIPVGFFSSAYWYA